MSYGDPERFVADLIDTAKRFEQKAQPISALPSLSDLRLALNVAAADLRPLVILRAGDAEQAARLEQRVAELAWAEDFVGRALYVVAREEESVGGLEPEAGLSVVQAEAYGRGAEVLSHAELSSSAEELAAALRSGLDAYEAQDRDYHEHIRFARRNGITWESAIEEADSEGKRSDPGRRRR